MMRVSAARGRRVVRAPGPAGTPVTFVNTVPVAWIGSI
ncbi:hypothetical protein QE399_001350 [Paracidovorax wautersii]|uniref:Uncharacterized protein n=1 Tax=Paracidovorax wautersii TaxID=1177982 RepID=A0ABU1I8V5_9BURK|nr:hypothetical protein [Paracidovorax wautersii]